MYFLFFRRVSIFQSLYSIHYSTQIFVRGIKQILELFSIFSNFYFKMVSVDGFWMGRFFQPLHLVINCVWVLYGSVNCMEIELWWRVCITAVSVTKTLISMVNCKTIYHHTIQKLINYYLTWTETRVKYIFFAFYKLLNNLISWLL